MDAEVTYDGGYDAAKDALIRKLAGKPSSGSGCRMTGRRTRDIGFEYTRLKPAQKLAAKLKAGLPKWAKVRMLL